MSVPSLKLRVHGFHCDLYGHVNNARYLEFLEAARWEWLRSHLDIDSWHDRGRQFVIVRIEIDYRAVSGMGDELEVFCEAGETRKSSSTILQRILRPSDGKTVVTAAITFVVLDVRTGRPLRIAGEIAEALGGLAAGPGRKSS